MTPSAKLATSAAWAPSRTPRPTATGTSEQSRTLATSPAAWSLTAARVPVMPISDAAYTKPRQRAVTVSTRDRVELGATRNTRSRP